MVDVRKGQAPAKLSRDAFRARFEALFDDPAYEAERAAIGRLEAIAWDAYDQGRKAPRTRKAGAEFADPDYELSVEWLAARARLQAAQARWADPAAPSRVLLINAATRNDGTCPGEMSKSWRLLQRAREPLAAANIEIDVLDLSWIASEPHRHIHPCKGCVSTAMPLCHWPCSCYPNHAAGQVNDWMNEIYERWVSAHGILVVTPTHWYNTSSTMKLMMDRLVCADGGNPDPTSTHGKHADEAKALELAGWDYPQHLKGRAYGVFAHGDVEGIDGTRATLCNWLDWMGLIDAGAYARVERYIGYYEPYATSHEALDRDEAVQEEVRNVARALAAAVAGVRDGTLRAPKLRRPRPK